MTIKSANSKALRYISLAVFLFTGVYFTSCEKEIKLDLATGKPSVVIEGQIENDGPPFVMITKSMGFFLKIDLSTLEENFVHGALVTIYDGTTLDTLREYSADTGGNGIKFYFYSVDTATLGNAIITGEFNKSYKLSVTYENVTYEATTKIPSVEGIDSLWGGKLPFPDPDAPNDAVGLYINVRDPDTTGNYIRYYTKRNDDPFYPVEVVSAEKLGIGGQKIDSVNIGFGYPPGTPRDSVNLIFPKMDDSITVKWCAVDKWVYDFWERYSFALASVGNPFASPMNLPTNFSNGALGIWSGYGTSYISIKVARW